MKTKKSFRPVMVAPVARKNFSLSAVSQSNAVEAQSYWNGTCGQVCDPSTGNCWSDCDFFSAFAADSAE